jgi:epoxyqueuosine reductase
MLDSGELQAKLVKPYRSLQEFAAPEWAANGSIVILAAPQSRSLLTVTAGGKKFDAVIPPTYISLSIKEREQKALEEAAGGRAAWALLPVKTLATRTGLCKYGRNNLCYAEGMGSYARLDAFYTEANLETDQWQEQAELDQCAGCRLCQHSCPSGAIREDRFYIDPLRCITCHNESLEAFPDWVRPEWHNAVIGCMRCSEACPVNRPFLDRVDRREELSEEETGLILKETPLADLPEALAAKLRALELDGLFEYVPRNLGTLVRGQ